jgi:uncharacterized coiled-coil protein SlyX
MEDLRQRIERLEDSLAFTEREKEQLSEQLLKAYEQIQRLARRLDALEGRLGSIEQGGEDPP